MHKLPAIWRHLILAILTVVITWLGTDFVPWLDARPKYGIILGALVAAALAVLTPLVQSYGLFARDSSGRVRTFNARGQ